jgi:protein MpaA
VDGWAAEVYGRSLRGAELRVLIPASAPRGVLVAGMHGEEPDTVLLAARLAERVPAGEAAFALVLAANPDGLAQGTRQNARGVDINRNFPAEGWAPGDSFTFPPGIDPAERVLPNRTNRSSTGAEPLSEPESAALARLLQRLGPSLVLDLHAPLELIMPGPGAPAATVQALAEAGGMPVVEELSAPAPGSMRDWLVEHDTPCLVYEIEHAGLPALCARHLPGLERLVRGELA